MRVKLYLDNPQFSAELGSRFALDGLTLEGGIETEVGYPCLCRETSISSLDVVIAHPEYTNNDGCWDRIASLAGKYPDTLFYIMAINASERTRYFQGIHPNLYAIDNQVRGFFRDPVGRIVSDQLSKPRDE